MNSPTTLNFDEDEDEEDEEDDEIEVKPKSITAAKKCMGSRESSVKRGNGLSRIMKKGSRSREMKRLATFAVRHLTGNSSAMDSHSAARKCLARHPVEGEIKPFKALELDSSILHGPPKGIPILAPGKLTMPMSPSLLTKSRGLHEDISPIVKAKTPFMLKAFNKTITEPLPFKFQTETRGALKKQILEGIENRDPTEFTPKVNRLNQTISTPLVSHNSVTLTPSPNRKMFRDL
eukprot:TRINITY_DN11398_c0_g1_i2.p1 TRINITY_DN11398_c0_g1~~TRINITY_DN11398_c0_g1_i2.p1  ORF type:complete len:234 (-),score=83.36 TRINITY_DN11398_c0_g1_i2:65-766(-)